MASSRFVCCRRCPSLRLRSRGTAVLDEVCESVSRCEIGVRTPVASKILEAPLSRAPSSGADRREWR
ncbi:hypothetical protein EAS62_36990 [Bradyrhizobium zhanjiangense]|uniref:Uncharacterized protein n=1 Tax=Bradyrhizobium zhanjiangense TaxID=1325107 RepID=A0ABY0D9F4_9BRAD|nr:hypothetical protein EAS62_36990 [Bradyrhizobium zhanjiangense]